MQLRKVVGARKYRFKVGALIRSQPDTSSTRSFFGVLFTGLSFCGPNVLFGQAQQGVAHAQGFGQRSVGLGRDAQQVAHERDELVPCSLPLVRDGLHVLLHVGVGQRPNQNLMLVLQRIVIAVVDALFKRSQRCAAIYAVVEVLNDCAAQVHKLTRRVPYLCPSR